MESLISNLRKLISALQEYINGQPTPLPPVDAKPDLIKKFADAITKHEGYYPGSRSYRNNNPGNAKFVGQPDATGKDAQGFAIFPSYGVGYEYLCRVLRNACTGKSKVYNPDMDLYAFFRTFAPSSDNNNPTKYAETVAKAMGVKPTDKIKTFV